jgi:glycosyltransferase involved in cell wall biosynthesis
MVNAAHKIFWSCDQYTNADGIWNATVFPYVDGVVSISPFHKSFLLQNYNVTEDKIKIIDLGVVWKDYENLPKKIKHQAIYCSVPQRGLDRLLRMLPEIKKRVPDFSLVITSDYRLWGLDTPENGSFIDQSRSFEYVKFLGKISREELVRHQLESEVMAYPSTYDECFCISAMECIAAGAVPVTVNRGSLNTTVSDSGLLLSSTSSDAEYVDSLVRLLTDEKLRKNLQEKGRKRAEIYDWDIIASKWDSYFKSFEGMPKSMIKCPYCEKTPINSYVLQQHIAKKHPETLQNDKEVNPIVTVEDLPKTTVIHFKVPVDIQINGRKYTGTSPEVLHEHVDAVVETARNAYGKDVI